MEEYLERAVDAPCAKCGHAPLDPRAVPLEEIRCPHCGARQPAPARFAGYVVRNRIALEPRIAVYRAVRRADGRRAALKILGPEEPPDGESIEAFLRRCEIVAPLRDAHVAELIEWNREGTVAYAVFSMDSGRTLAEWLARRRRLVLDEVLRIALDTARGIAAFSARGLVHGDLRPATILIDGEETARAADLGLSFQFHLPGDDGFRETWATAPYAPPERAGLRRADPALDLYGLGAVMYHMLCGRPPFRPDALRIEERASRPPPDPQDWFADCPFAVRQIIRGLMAPRPEERIPRMRDLVREIAEVLDAVAPRRGIPLRDLIGVATLVGLMIFAAVSARRLRNVPEGEAPVLRPLSGVPAETEAARTVPLPGSPEGWAALGRGEWRTAMERFAAAPGDWNRFWSAVAAALAGLEPPGPVDGISSPEAARALRILRGEEDFEDGGKTPVDETTLTCRRIAASIRSLQTDPRVGLAFARRLLASPAGMEDPQRAFFVRLRDRCRAVVEGSTGRPQESNDVWNGSSCPGSPL